jgi:hypothetical protein
MELSASPIEGLLRNVGAVRTALGGAVEDGSAFQLLPHIDLGRRISSLAEQGTTLLGHVPGRGPDPSDVEELWGAQQLFTRSSEALTTNATYRGELMRGAERSLSRAESRLAELFAR